MPTDDFAKKKQRHASGESTVSTISTYIPVPPDGGYGWVIVFASFFNHLIVDGITFTFGVFYPEFVDFFGGSRAHTALVGSLQAGCYFLAAPFAGALINKYGCRPICIMGAIIASLAFVAASFSQSLNFLMVVYGIIGGVGLGFIYLPSIISVTYYFHNKRAFATGIACCGAGVGTFLFAPLGRFLLDTFSWRWTMVVEAGILLNTAIFGMLLRPLTPAKKTRRPRSKNVLDRIKKKATGKDGIEGEEESSVGEHAQTYADVQRARAAREALIEQEEYELDEESEHQPLSPTESEVKANGTLPEAALSILVEEHNDSPAIPLKNEESVALLEANGKNVRVDLCQPQQAPGKNGIKMTVSLPCGINTQVTNLRYGALPSSSPHQYVGRNKRSASVDASKPRRPPRTYSCGPSTATSDEITADKQAAEAQKRAEATATLKVESVRPMYRKDIFLSGSLLNVVQFRSAIDIKSFMHSMTAIPPEATSLDGATEERSRCSRLLHLSTAVSHVFTKMLDFTLFADPVFVIAALANACGMFALFTPFIYFVDRAVSLNVPITQAAYLLSVIGITNIVGRVGTGFVADLPRVNSLVLHNLSILLMGVVCVLTIFSSTFIGMCVAAMFFGLGMAGWISLTSIILCNLMGLEKLTNAFGLLTMIRGIAVICGPPVAGILYEQTQDYDITFLVGGLLLLLSGVLFCCLHLPCLRKYRKDLKDGDCNSAKNKEAV